jgi:hypothetical protein
VAVKGYGIELRQYRYPKDPGIDAVTDGNVDEAVLARHWNCRFGALLSERE